MPRKPETKPRNPDLDRPYKEIGDRIKTFRIGKKLQQVDIVPEGSHTMTISRVERGLRAPTVELLAYLRSIGADLNHIIAGE